MEDRENKTKSGLLLFDFDCIVVVVVVVIVAIVYCVTSCMARLEKKYKQTLE